MKQIHLKISITLLVSLFYIATFAQNANNGFKLYKSKTVKLNGLGESRILQNSFKNNIWITLNNQEKIKGSISAVNDSTLSLTNINTLSYTKTDFKIAADKILLIEARKKHSHIKKMLIGGLIGVPVGGLIGLTTYKPETFFFSGFELLGATIAGAFFGGLTGSAIGFGLGFAKIAIPINGKMANYKNNKHRIQQNMF